MAIKLTQKEAEALINMMKKKVEDVEFDFPAEQGRIEFDVKGERRTDEFVINIQRKGIDASKCTYLGRIKSNNIILIRLDVNPTSVHTNISGEKIKGTHLHIYSEDHELKDAIPFDVESKDLFEVCFSFFEKFNIVDPPRMQYKPNLF